MNTSSNLVYYSSMTSVSCPPCLMACATRLTGPSPFADIVATWATSTAVAITYLLVASKTRSPSTAAWVSCCKVVDAISMVLVMTVVVTVPSPHGRIGRGCRTLART